MKRKETKIMVLILMFIILIIVFFFCYKGYNLHYYTFTEEFKKVDISTTLKIKKYDNYNNILKYEKITIKNIFKDFHLSRDKYFDKYVLYDSNNKIKASFWIGIDKSFVDLLKEDALFYGSLEKIESGYFRELLTKRSIKDDVSLFKFLEKKSRYKVNIFTSVSDMREIYAAKYLLSILFSESDDISLIEGDYKGYVFNSKVLKEVSILYNNKRYILTFFGLNYFTDDIILDELNSIMIK